MCDTLVVLVYIQTVSFRVVWQLYMKGCFHVWKEELDNLYLTCRVPNHLQLTKTIELMQYPSLVPVATYDLQDRWLDT